MDISMPMSYACIYVPELSLTSKTREKLQGQLGISGVPNRQIRPRYCFEQYGTIQHIQPRSIVSKHQQPHATSISQKKRHSTRV